MFYAQSFLEALDGRAEVANFYKNFSFLDVNFGNGLVVEDDFVKADKSRFPFFELQSLFRTSELLQDFIFFDATVVEFLCEIGKQALTLNTVTWPSVFDRAWPIG